ncbi:MAG: DUF1553 domain-containing protein [Verrucomicrobiae bacterium]|nr:DUF1553 domain-containing protein [Verrucomicrobiae bacterium]
MSAAAVLTALLSLAATSNAAERLTLLPAESTLSGPESFQRLMALRVNESGDLAGEASNAALASSDPKVAEVRDGMVFPKSDGTVTITATAPDGGTATARVTVRESGATHEWSFRNHVLPVLAKGGCNMGACHGALAGKGGFRLSLRGYDPEMDWHRITREARGRRVELGDPGASLLLTKATTALKHTGGKRVEPGSRDYRVLSEWISAGAPAPKPNDARLESLEIFPPLSTLKPQDAQRFIVRARYTDGREEDVTQWAKFTSSNEAVAMVDEDGHATVVGHGEGAVTAWFSAKIVIARISSPWPNDLPDELFTSAPRANFIDDLVLAQLRRLNLKPSPRATDTEFIRRAFIDTIGMLPKPEETRAFLADASPDKRERLIESLLGRTEFVDYWAYRISDMMLVSGRNLRPEAVKAYYSWVREAVAANEPWDAFARDVVTAKGSTVKEGATNFYSVHQEPETMAENVSQTFLSLSLNCAKCHDHPLEKWTNDQYYAFANLFSRVRAKGWGGDARNGDGIRTVYVEPRGDLIQPRTGKPQPPAPLDAPTIDPGSDADRREALAEWLTSPDNEHFSRSIANKIWANFFGIGLVDPVDDLRASNPASNEPLLAALADHLVKEKFDLKALMRAILRSETYQRSSEALYENREDDRFFSRQFPRRLIAEVLHDGIAQVTGVPTDFTEVALNDGSKAKTDFYPKGTRALELYDSAVDSYFLKTFGRNEREISCECERSNQPSLVQVLHVANGVTVNDKLASKDGIVEAMLKAKRPDAEIIDEAYLRCLSRPPTETEKSGFLDLLASTPEAEKRAAMEDLFWALMSSREFLFQH